MFCVLCRIQEHSRMIRPVGVPSGRPDNDTARIDLSKLG